MTVAPSPTTFAVSNREPDMDDGFSANPPGSKHAFRKIFRNLWPSKAAPNLASVAGISVRQAERMLSNKGPSASTLLALLRSENGFPILQELMRGSTPRWWRDLARTKELADLRRRQEEQRRTIERLEQEAGE